MILGWTHENGDDSKMQNSDIYHANFLYLFPITRLHVTTGGTRFSFSQVVLHVEQVYLAIRQRGWVVYELIVNEGAARVDYLFRDNEAELSNCFSIHSYLKYKLWGILEIFDQKLL